jgi:hydrogenase expression/formation protein HypE
LRTIDRITLSHGAGGQAMSDLIESVFISAYGLSNSPRDDSALVGDLAFTTDSFVVSPIFFPGGDIGRLAVSGTVNDLLTAAARPVAIAASFIIEEGLEVDVLKCVVDSMQATADECDVKIVTGDTKVVPRGSADKLFITTAGIGKLMRFGVSGASARPGDVIILTGTIGDHGAAVMLARENLLNTVEVKSDVAPLVEIVVNLIESGCEVHTMRDPTRGGIGSALNEIALQSGTAIQVNENLIGIKPPVRATCEALGIDPYYMASEGRMLIITAPQDAQKALDIVRSSRYGENAAIIGEVHSMPAGRVQVRTKIGTNRILAKPSGELVPRIC